ncbi:MAG: TetR/AcrR family transcriptional regulator [Bowdeniella nasicola]|nr:TetR/AcrR family transcriptional regulator [Bowdeniella nasicola]
MDKSVSDSIPLDPRSARSRARLREALSEALQVLPFEHITIVLLTQRAGVNRSTFYRHYATTNDLLHDLMLARLSEAGLADFVPSAGEMEDPNPPEAIHELVRFIAHNRVLFRERLPRSSQQSIVLLFMDYLTELVARSGHREPVAEPDNLPMISAALAGAAMGVLSRWLVDETGVEQDELALWVWSILRLLFVAQDETEVKRRIRDEMPWG